MAMPKRPYWEVPLEYEDDTGDFYQEYCCQATKDLTDYMHVLWQQHVYWTRMVIISIVNNLPDEEATTNRLLRNAKDFEKAFSFFYNEKIAHNFSNLLTDHLVIADELVKAAKAGDQKLVDTTEQRWYRNADEIINFLDCTNPYWPEDEMKAMWYEHLSLTKSEALMTLTQKHRKSIAIFGQIEQEALLMADSFANGLIKQFPDSILKSATPSAL